MRKDHQEEDYPHTKNKSGRGISLTLNRKYKESRKKIIPVQKRKAERELSLYRKGKQEEEYP